MKLNICLEEHFALLGKVCNGLQHPVTVEQGQQVVRARLLPQGGSQAFPGLVVLYSSWAPKESSVTKRKRQSLSGEQMKRGLDVHKAGKCDRNLLKFEQTDIVFLIFPEKN